MVKNLKISTLLFLLSSSLLTVLLAKQVRADCTKWHPHHCGIRDVEREFNNCFNGGCSIPADEAWGEAGRSVYTAGLTLIAANNSTLPAKSLTTWQKDRLRPYFGNLVDRVAIKYGATTLDNWRIGGTRISIPSDGQTFCNNIYLTKRHRGEDKDLLALIAHEMVHSQQCERLGGASNFGYNYFKYYKRANQNYRNNKLEVEAYDIEAKFVNELESIEQEIARKNSLETVSVRQDVPAGVPNLMIQTEGYPVVAVFSGRKESFAIGCMEVRNIWTKIPVQVVSSSMYNNVQATNPVVADLPCDGSIRAYAPTGEPGALVIKHRNGEYYRHYINPLDFIGAVKAGDLIPIDVSEFRTTFPERGTDFQVYR